MTDIQRAARYFLRMKISFGADNKTYGCNTKNLENAVRYLSDVQKRLMKPVRVVVDLKRRVAVFVEKNPTRSAENLNVAVECSLRGNKLYRVQIGAFASRQNALNYLAQAKMKGFDGFIVEV